MPNKYFIIAEGIGFGHIARCSQLYYALEKKGKVTIFTFGDSYKRAKELGLNVENLNFDFVLSTDKNGLNVEYNAIEYIKDIKILEVAKLAAKIRKEKPKVLFVDSSIIGLIVASLTRHPNIIYITNNNTNAVSNTSCKFY